VPPAPGLQPPACWTQLGLRTAMAKRHPHWKSVHYFNL